MRQFIWPRSRLFIFKVDHLPQLCLERIACLVYLGLEMGFYCFRSKSCRGLHSFLSIGLDLWKSFLFLLSRVLLFHIDRKSLLFVQPPINSLSLDILLLSLAPLFFLILQRITQQTNLPILLVILIIKFLYLIDYLRLLQWGTLSLPPRNTHLICIDQYVHEPGPTSDSFEFRNLLLRDLNWWLPSSWIFTIIIFLFSYLLIDGLINSLFIS